MNTQHSSAVELYWLPLGAGGHSVRINGQIFEAVAAALARRPRMALFHSALIVTLNDRKFTIEQTPVPSGDPSARGVVAGGSVGSSLISWLRIFRYEIRCWEGGEIPDVAEAVESPRLLSTDAVAAQRIIETIERVPSPVWGRDELRTGEMWNSNSVIAWTLEEAGLGAERIAPPYGGRAPGWNAGWRVAQNDAASSA